MTREAWIIDAVRSPRGKGKETGSLHGVHPQRILAQVLEGLRARVGFETDSIDDVIMGCAAESGDHAMDIARMAVLDAGWALDVPGITINRFCGSGQQAITFAAMAVLSGHQDLLVAGGVECMSRPADLHVDGFSANNAHLFDKFSMVHQGISADLLATLDGMSRDELDQIGVDSQDRAAKALAEDRFADSLIPIAHDDGTPALDHDEFPRPGTTLADLAKLAPSFEAMGASKIEGHSLTVDEEALLAYPSVPAITHVHHAGNSSGVVDGASAVLVASSDYARAHGLLPRARIVMTAVAGTEPVLMLTAPAPATKRCVEKAGMTLDDIDLFEINEAFAAVIVRWLRETGVDWSRVNVNGGAIALGHPIGATGGILIGTVLDELERQDKSTGLVSMCTGGGQATATIIERI
jgi:acetyl-CoA C-acetyltransferase